MSLQAEVRQLYKNLLHLGRDYPLGYDFFRVRLKRGFLRHRDETDPQQIRRLIERGNFVCKELEALYMLRKYRTLNKRYYEEKGVWLWLLNDLVTVIGNLDDPNAHYREIM